MSGRRPRLTLDDYERGIVAGDRAVLARAITLVESVSPRDEATAQAAMRAVAAAYSVAARKPSPADPVLKRVEKA